MEPGDPQGKRVAIVGGGLVGNAIWLPCDCVCQGAGAVKALLGCGVNIFLKIIPPSDDGLLWRSWLSCHCGRQQGSFEQLGLCRRRTALSLEVKALLLRYPRDAMHVCGWHLP